MMKIRASVLMLAVGWLGLPFASKAAETEGVLLPSFAEVFGVVRSNLTGTSEAELNRAAVLGMISQLQSRVLLITNGVASSSAMEVPLIPKSSVLESAYGFVRIARIAPGLDQELRKACQQLLSSNRVKGLVIDLRFAMGDSYSAATEAADLFVANEQTLLQLGETVLKSTTKSDPIEAPVVILINRETHGAAEAFAAALRQAIGALLLGTPTAGRAYLFKDFHLSTGPGLRVATGFIATGNGERLSETGVAPDIRVAVSFEDEKAYFEDPYRVLPKPFAQATRPGTNDLAQSANRPRRRLNEAELVRMQREGMDFDMESAPVSAPQPAGPIISDPVLSRALDLLKGLSLAAKRR